MAPSADARGFGVDGGLGANGGRRSEPDKTFGADGRWTLDLHGVYGADGNFDVEQGFGSSRVVASGTSDHLVSHPAEVSWC